MPQIDRVSIVILHVKVAREKPETDGGTLQKRPFVCVVVSAFEVTTANIMFGSTKNTI